MPSNISVFNDMKLSEEGRADQEMLRDMWPDDFRYYEGGFESCLAGDCPNNCCSYGMVDKLDGAQIEVNAGLMSVSEYFYMNYYNERLDELGVAIDHLEVVVDGRQFMAFAVTNCFIEGEGCKLPRELRPLVCKLYPFRLESVSNPITQDCPCWREIYLEARQSGMLAKIFKIRNKLGYGDNKTWSRNLKQLINNKK